MKSLILAYRRLARAPFMIRALVGLLTFATAVLIEVLLDAVWTHFHIDLYTADRFVHVVASPIVGLLVAPMLSSLAPLFHGAPSGRTQRFDCDDPFNGGNEVTSHALRHDDFDFPNLHDDDSRDWPGRLDSGANWHTDPSYSWFSENIFYDDPHWS